MTSRDVAKSNPRALAQLMSKCAMLRRLWQADELRAVFEHQMSSAVQFDLGNLNRGTKAKLVNLAESENLLLKDFRTLFEHPCPPIELLVLTKDFAKANVDHPESDIPSEIARVLYYESILIARTRCGRHISSLDDQAISNGVTWALTQEWLDERTRETLMDGLAILHKPQGEK